MYQGVATGKGIQIFYQSTCSQSIEPQSINSIKESSSNSIVQQNSTPLNSQNESFSKKTTFPIKEIHITFFK